MKVGVLKEDNSMFIDDTGAPMNQATADAMKPEKPKPLYDQKQQMGIAHFLIGDIVQLVDLLEQMYGDDNPYWERIKYDVERLKTILEDGLTGGGPMQQ